MKNYQPKETFTPKFIINQVESMEMGQKVFDKLSATANKHFSNNDQFKLDVGYLGFIPYDRNTFRETEKLRRPYVSAFPDRPAAKCIRHIASELLVPESMRESVPPMARFSQRAAPFAAESSRPRPHKSSFHRFVEILKLKF